MNGYDFNRQVLKPWQRDPAFYKLLYTERSDVPAHEGPTNHMAIDLWKYSFPLSSSDKLSLMNSLKTIPAFNSQAKLNLTGNAKELWVAGIRDIQTQSEELADILNKPGSANDAVPTETPFAPAKISSSASRPVETPPIPKIGTFGSASCT